MADGQPQQGSRPLGSLIEAAKNGDLSVKFNENVRLNAEEFAYIDRDCDEFKSFIRSAQGVANDIARQKKWGLGEDQDILPSAKILVSRFRNKAGTAGDGHDNPNNVHDILEQHYQCVHDIQTLHKTIAQKLIDTDQEFAAAYKEISEHMPPSPITSNHRPLPKTP
ncbi:MAG: hypothetical protein J2P18_15225 [Nocardia sp.]|nr:hypothetical protein [Nocardia sp.]